MERNEKKTGQQKVMVKQRSEINRVLFLFVSAGDEKENLQTQVTITSNRIYIDVCERERRELLLYIPIEMQENKTTGWILFFSKTLKPSLSDRR